MPTFAESWENYKEAAKMLRRSPSLGQKKQLEGDVKNAADELLKAMFATDWENPTEQDSEAFESMVQEEK